MSSIKGIFIGLGWLTLAGILHGQLSVQSLGTAQPAPPDSIVQITAEAQGLNLMSPADLPRSGTFWLVGSNGSMVPMPCPLLNQDLPTFAITENVFLVDGTGGQVSVNPRRFGLQTSTSSTISSALEIQANAVMDLINRIQETQFEQQMTMVFGMDAPSPGDGGTNSFAPNGASFTVPDYGTNLWIAQVCLTNGYLAGIGMNTIADVQFEIQSRTNLLQSDWQSEGFIFGSETTNWTPLTVAQNGRPNLFLRLLSWADDGSGLPIWWQEQYFGVASGVDPYGNPAGDGWSNLQKFQNGMNPNQFYTPAAPQEVSTAYNPDTAVATISWLPATGPVTGYTVTDSDGHTSNFSAGTTSFQSTVPNSPDVSNGDPTIYRDYQVRADYSAGNSALSSQTPLQKPAVTASAFTGTAGIANLALYGLPDKAVKVRLTMHFEQDYVLDNSIVTYTLNTNHDILASAFTNGIFQLPTGWQNVDLGVDPDAIPYGYTSPRFYQFVQSIDGAGNASGANWVWDQVNEGNWAESFHDGRRQLKDNLVFLLRAANTAQPFGFEEYNPDDWLMDITNPVNYAYAGFYAYSKFYDENYVLQFSAKVNPTQPYEDNYLYRNFVYDPAVVDSGGAIETGLQGRTYYDSHVAHALEMPPASSFPIPSPATSWGTVSSVLEASQTGYLAILPLGARDPYWGQIGLQAVYTSPAQIQMAANAKNVYGLSFLNTLAVSNGPVARPLSAGNSLPYGAAGYLYSETAFPQFQTVEYDFFNPNWSWNYALQQPVPPSLPGFDNFSATDQSQQFFTTPGASIQIAGYAKLALQNGYAGKYGYLGQYFDQAYKMDTNGNATTNTTGVLSPYGNFFSTEPGPTALVTMPDVDTGARGTCMVYSVSLQLDANHDGNMDLSFNGPDNTSQASPMRFWVNNDYDFSSQPGYPVFDPGSDKPITLRYSDQFMKDYLSLTPNSIRDLEDWARLWICGVPALTNAGYQVTLSWANVSGSPAINLIRSCETNGGTLYLTDANVSSLDGTAWKQISSDYGWKYHVPTTGTLTLPGNWFSNSINKYFLFEGAGIGSGELVMTISQNGNTIAQTGLWLDLHDVKDFYERAVITNNMSGAKSNWTSSVEVVQPAVSSALGNDTNLIVLVHGINVTTRDCSQQGDTVFKRLYWAGFQGKFASVKWPCNLLTPIPDPLSPAVFNDSELQGYKASTALTTCLNGLKARFPNYRLNILAHSQGNAVVSEAIKNGLTFDTYILTQGALPDSAYDVDAPINATMASYEHGEYITPEWQPMGYRGVYTNSNFAGRVVNFYNPNDPVLDYWVTDQKKLKPTYYVSTSHYYYDGVNSYFYPVLADPYLVTDPEESRADVSRSRTLPIGQSGPASAHGVIKSAVNLYANFGFYNAFPDDHSAQWTWPIQTTRPYFQQVLTSCGIQPAP